jgi:mannan endo-1,4-beta-mannosidase
MSEGPLDACSLEAGQGSGNASLAATAGQLYPLRIEYKEVVDSASVKLYYSSPSIVRAIVPSSRLFHSAQVSSAAGRPLRPRPTVLLPCCALAKRLPVPVPRLPLPLPLPWATAFRC